MITWLKPNGLQIETNDRKETIEAAERFGWKRMNHAKKGSGIPGTEQCHRTAILGKDSKEEIYQYVVAVCGEHIDLRGSIATIQKKAIKALTNGDS